MLTGGARYVTSNASCPKIRAAKGILRHKNLAVLDLVIKSYNRFDDLEKLYDLTTDGELSVKFSAEMRQLTMGIARLLGMVSTNPPPATAPPSKKTQQASQAARTRWAG